MVLKGKVAPVAAGAATPCPPPCGEHGTEFEQSMGGSVYQVSIQTTPASVSAYELMSWPFWRLTIIPALVVSVRPIEPIPG